MRTFALLVVAIALATPVSGQVLRFADLNMRQFAKLDPNKTVVVVPGGILEEHGPYLPSGSDAVVNTRLANDLASYIATRPGWTALLLPSVPYRSWRRQRNWAQVFFSRKLCGFTFDTPGCVHGSRGPIGITKVSLDSDCARPRRPCPQPHARPGRRLLP